MIHRVRGLEYVAAIYRRDYAPASATQAAGREGLPEIGQETAYPIDDGEPGRDSVHFETARTRPHLVEGRAFRWNGAYLTALELDPAWVSAGA